MTVKTKVYACYVGSSALDARYLGTIEDSPEVIKQAIKANPPKGFSHFETFPLQPEINPNKPFELIIFGHRQLRT